MTRTTYPMTTVSGISAFDLDDVNAIRWSIPLWEDLPTDIKMQQEENDAVLLDFYNQLPRKTKEYDQPIIQWNLDSRLEGFTTLATAFSPGDGHLEVADTKVARAGNGLYLPATDQIFLCTTADDANSELDINETAFGSTVKAASIGDAVFVLPAYMGELSEPHDTTSVLPGEPQFNYITICALKITLSKMQINRAMKEGEGASFLTLDRATQETVFKTRQQIMYGLMFQNRATWLDATYGQFYVSGSLMSQMTDHVLDLTANGNTFAWPTINDYLEQLFDSKQSSTHKDIIGGPAAFANMLKSARDVGRLVMSGEGETYMNPKFGVRSFDFMTDSGDTVTFMRDRGSLLGELSNTAFVLDKKNMSGGQYKGLGAQWFMNIQSPVEIMKYSAAYLDSFALNVLDPSTMGVIKGGTKSII